MIQQPQWIAKMYPGKVGRDHLGLGSVSSDQILRALSPGVNVLTIHPRYHSFYVFLLDEFWRRDRPRSRKPYMAFYRPREFIFSVGTYLCDRPEHGEMYTVVGGQKTQPLANRKLPHYDTGFHYMDSELGGYGLYYRSVMAELGLVYPGGPGFPYPMDVPTEKGKEVAAAFRKAVQNTAYYRQFFDTDITQVPLEVIREYIRKACLCQLQVADAPDRPLLLDNFLHAGEPDASVARRATFRFFLDIAAQTAGHVIDQDTFRQLLYFRMAPNGVTYNPRECVLDTYQRWRMYQAREYYAFALNAMWSYLCYWGIVEGGDVRPLPLDVFWQHLDAALDFDTLAVRLNLRAPGLHVGNDFQSLLDWLKHTVGGDEVEFDLACDLRAPIHEHHLYTHAISNRTAPDIMVAGMLVMLGLIYLRFGRPDYWLRPEWQISRLGSDGRLSVDGFVKTMRIRLQRGHATIGEIARWLYADYIIQQHQRIAGGKMPENTYRFQRRGNRLEFFLLENSLSFMDYRFQTLSTTMHELGFCGDFGVPSHPLTTPGFRLLAEGDLV
ncbi:MAG: hypothetical protein HY326_13525 [Chloroflexi bacterium]|nr:hypothetical protein [Chloroflexota bacterium]